MWSLPRRYRSRRQITRTFMSVSSNGATSVTNRASWCVAPSFSPPTDCMIAIWFAVTAVGMPSTNSRTVNGSGRVPSKAWLAPTMSLLNMPCTSLPAASICAAMKAEPYSPCSSPATVANTRVPGNWRVANSRASSSTTATPDPSSSAPGASLVKSSTSVTRESRWPVTT